MDITEITIAELHELYRSNEMTVRDVIEQYIERIELYDRVGPELQSILTINPNALDRADELDRVFETSGDFVGALHGIPIVVKDQVETKDITTTFGSETCLEYVPTEDATVIKELREAGAVILGKTNLSDWATNWFCFSSAMDGRTKNPYELGRDAGGSSGGTGTAVAANLGTVGLGEDTGGSIRVPSSFNNLFGVRVTPGLISRTGVQSLIKQLDTTGPMTRTVEDAARMLDVLVGYDSTDDYTAVTELTDTGDTYLEALDADALSGARLGVVRQVFGDESDPEIGPVNEVVNSAIDTMHRQGAEIVDPVSIPDLEAHLDKTSLYRMGSKSSINEFLQDRDEIPVESVSEIFESGRYHELHDQFEAIAQGPAIPEETPKYWEKVAAMDIFQRAVLNVFAEHELDALIYPDAQVLPPQDELIGRSEIYENSFKFPANTLIASQARCCAMSVPAGFTNDGIPVGIELTGKPYCEATLLGLAYAFEQATDPRSPPEIAPTVR